MAIRGNAARSSRLLTGHSRCPRGSSLIRRPTKHPTSVTAPLLQRFTPFVLIAPINLNLHLFDPPKTDQCLNFPFLYPSRPPRKASLSGYPGPFVSTSIASLWLRNCLYFPPLASGLFSSPFGGIGKTLFFPLSSRNAVPPILLQKKQFLSSIRTA